MVDWSPLIVLVLPALVPSLAAALMTVRWVRWLRRGGEPDASGWDGRYAMMALVAGIGRVACLVYGVATLFLGAVQGEGTARHAGLSAACGVSLPFQVAGVTLLVLGVLDTGLLFGAPGAR